MTGTPSTRCSSTLPASRAIPISARRWSSETSPLVRSDRPPRSRYSTSLPPSRTQYAPAARGERDDVTVRFAEIPQPIDGSRQSKLRAAQPFHEIAAPDPARLLHCAEHGVQAGEPARPSLARDRFTRQDAVPL